MASKRLGVALVGLGYYASEQLAPALQQTEHCYLAGIVTGTPSKIPAWKEKYNIPDENIYSYSNFDLIKTNPHIDIVYVVLPNHLHAEYSIRAAKANKHIICEKPMAVTVEECDAMLKASNCANKYLSIGYRLQYDPYHLEMVRLAKEKVYGEIKSIHTAFSLQPAKGEWRLNKQIAGGGPLMDLGIYCLQAVCYITGMQPVSVTAKTSPVTDKEKFIDIEESVNFQMKMPNGIIASCRTSYSADENFLRMEAEKGWFELKPAFNYNGLKLNTSDGLIMKLHPFSQQAKQLDAIALSIKNNEPSKVPGVMGKRDLVIMKAIYEAMNSGKTISLN